MIPLILILTFISSSAGFFQCSQHSRSLLPASKKDIIASCLVDSASFYVWTGDGYRYNIATDRCEFIPSGLGGKCPGFKHYYDCHYYCIVGGAPVRPIVYH
ncbi:hypothetical protein DSO57_1027113 [Entomophthora muscae]|uniref:Uncharacterized protein n=1 Tax=Entomophthora muscae TaxID=34485 RepID=A0ACC2TD19_9FUNG|nr:hypothetical protein DSO57_1027113 [Entomophthora muscae]